MSYHPIDPLKCEWCINGKVEEYSEKLCKKCKDKLSLKVDTIVDDLDIKPNFMMILNEQVADALKRIELLKLEILKEESALEVIHKAMKEECE